MKRIILILFCLFVSQSAFGAAFDPSLKWQTIKTDHFYIHYGAELEQKAKAVAKYLEEAHEKLSPKFKWKPWRHTEVIVVDNNDSANGLSSTLPYNWILLRLASPGPDSVLADYDNWLRELCFHEYTHILHIDQIGGVMKVPRLFLGKIVSPNGTDTGWLREGTATYIETTLTTKGRGYSSYAEMMLRTAILNGDFPAIDEADGVGWRWPGYQSMYIYGVKFLQYLTDVYGEEKLVDFHNRVAKSPLLYGLNHQARKAFGDIQFEPKKVHNRYERVRKEGTKRSKSFYGMWKDWKALLEKQYAGVKADLEAEGLTQFEDVAAGGTVLSSPAVSRDGKYLAYARVRVKGPAELHLVDLETGVNKIIKKRQLATHISFSPDSKKIVYSANGNYKIYNVYSDLHMYDLETKKFTKLTTGKRAYDPSFSPDGKKIIFVRQEEGTGSLMLYNVETKEISDLEFKEKDKFMQFSAPVFSPDGKKIAVASWQIVRETPYPIGQWDIYLAEISNDKLQISNFRKLTNDTAINSSPVFSPDGKAIYYSSDKSGVDNIYKITLSLFPPPSRGRVGEGGRITSHESRVTNVLTGVFQPAISPDGSTLYAQYYNGYGFDIRKTVIKSASQQVGKLVYNPPAPPFRKVGDGGITLEKEYAGEIKTGDELKTKKYSPFGKSLFLPRFIIPSMATIDDGIMVAAFTGGADPLRRHNWMGGVTYRTDYSDYIGYGFNYFYNRYKPVFSLGILAYAVNFGERQFYYTSTDTTHTFHLFEERRRLYGGISYPWKKQVFSLQYFWEKRNPSKGLYQEEKDYYNFGNFAGFNVSYAYGQWEKYPASISSEHGRKMRLNFSVTDRALGSSWKNEQYIFAGDYREYVSMPWANQVLALRAGGGMVWGDELKQGTFTLGGALGEGLLGGGDSLYYFPLRGLPVASFSSTRALLISGEYRIPLFSPQRGLGTLPFFVQNIHFAPFLDFGNVWNADTKNGSYFFNHFLLGTGAEIRGDFILGHGLPVSGRVGYGIIIRSRDRLGNAQDPVLKTAAKYGLLVLQLGTSF